MEGTAAVLPLAPRLAGAALRGLHRMGRIYEASELLAETGSILGREVDLVVRSFCVELDRLNAFGGRAVEIINFVCSGYSAHRPKLPVWRNDGVKARGVSRHSFTTNRGRMQPN